MTHLSLDNASHKTNMQALGARTAFDLNHKGLPYRTPNKTGHGEHRYTVHATVTNKGRQYRAAIYQGRTVATLEITLYLNGRAIPDNQLQALKLTVLADYRDTFGPLNPEQEYPGHGVAPIKLTKPAPVIIDCTPTWASLVPALVAMIENGSAQSRTMAIEEITRLARFADATIADGKAKRAQNA